jgi:hypothetical protein
MPDDERGDEGEEAERKQKHHVYACFKVVDHFICCCPHLSTHQNPKRKRTKEKKKEIPRKMIKGFFFFSNAAGPLKATNKEL